MIRVISGYESGWKCYHKTTRIPLYDDLSVKIFKEFQYDKQIVRQLITASCVFWMKSLIGFLEKLRFEIHKDRDLYSNGNTLN